MTGLPDFHPICGHRTGHAYQGTLDVTTDEAVQTDAEQHDIHESVEQKSVEAGISGGFTAAIVGITTSIRGYLKGRITTADKERVDEIQRQSQTTTVSQTVHIETVNTVGEHIKLGCQDTDCEFHDEKQKIRVIEDIRVDEQELVEALNVGSLDVHEDRFLEAITIESADEFEWAGDIEQSDQDTDDTLTVLEEEAESEHDFENVIAVNRESEPTEENELIVLEEEAESEHDFGTVVETTDQETERDDSTTSDGHDEDTDRDWFADDREFNW